MDGTQGPAASISCGGAAITRVHCAFYNENEEFPKWQQNNEKQVNFLEEVSEHYPMQNGYVVLPKSGKDLPEWPKDPAELQKLLEKTKIGYHKDCQVTTGHDRQGTEVVADPKQLVDQVFCAAMNTGQGFSGMVNGSSPNSKARCKLVLDTAYEGTYLGAIANGRKHVVLTLIGGGVFGNSKSLIYKAILDAHLKWADCPGSTLEIVSLVVYSDWDMNPDFPELLSKEGIPWQITCWKDDERYVLEKH